MVDTIELAGRVPDVGLDRAGCFCGQIDLQAVQLDGCHGFVSGGGGLIEGVVLGECDGVSRIHAIEQ